MAIKLWESNLEKTVRKSSLKQRHVMKYLISSYTAFLTIHHTLDAHIILFVLLPIGLLLFLLTTNPNTYNTYSTHVNLGCYACRRS